MTTEEGCEKVLRVSSLQHRFGVGLNIGIGIEIGVEMEQFGFAPAPHIASIVDEASSLVAGSDDFTFVEEVASLLGVVEQLRLPLVLQLVKDVCV